MAVKRNRVLDYELPYDPWTDGNLARESRCVLEKVLVVCNSGM